jgi:hypothetical protein
MRGLTLYVRSRHVPPALAAAIGCMAVSWTLWSVFSDNPEAGRQMVVLTVLMLVTIATATLAGHDDELDRTAARRWPRLRVTHLLAALALVLVLVLATLPTGARFGPYWLAVRDAAGLTGLVALGAATLGVAKSWFLPLGWTILTVTIPLQSEKRWVAALMWQVQEPANRVAATTAVILAVAGSAAYVLGGSRKVAV